MTERGERVPSARVGERNPPDISLTRWTVSVIIWAVSMCVFGMLTYIGALVARPEPFGSGLFALGFLGAQLVTAGIVYLLLRRR